MKIESGKLKSPALDYTIATMENLPIKYDPMGFGKTANGGYWIWPERSGVPDTRLAQQIGKGYGLAGCYSPSAQPALADAIVQRGKICTVYDHHWKHDPTDPDDNGDRWCAHVAGDGLSMCYGSTPCEAQMRAWVRHCRGPEVDVPEELLA